MTTTLTQTSVTCKFLFDDEYLGDVMETCSEVDITPLSILWENVPYPHTQETNNVTVTFQSEGDRIKFIQNVMDYDNMNDVDEYISLNS